MKNIKQDLDELRPEYKRSDFRGEFVRGKYAWTQLEFSEVVSLLIACIGEDEGLKFTRHSAGNYRAGQKLGDWTYKIDNANQITLQYWLNELRSIDEPITNPVCVTNAQERSDLHLLLLTHVRLLKNRVGAL